MLVTTEVFWNTAISSFIPWEKSSIHVQNTSITIHETDTEVQRGFPSRLLDSSFKTHKKLTTFILGQNHLAHQSVTVLHPALRIDCVVFGTFTSSGTTPRKTNFQVQSFIFGLQCTLDFFCKIPTCSKKFHTCFNNNALFVCFPHKA